MKEKITQMAYERSQAKTLSEGWDFTPTLETWKVNNIQGPLYHPIESANLNYNTK